MAKLGLSSKRVLIDKANTTVTVVMALTTFISISSVMAIRTLAAKRTYQAKVISAKTSARKQLQVNKAAVENLKQAYGVFVTEPTNAISGSSTGTGDKDGDNAKITLDALPSKYDFPALTSSIEKLLIARNFKIKTITGNDDEIAQKDVTSNLPEPVDMPIEFSVIGSYDPFVELIKVLEKTIRPIDIGLIKITASETEMTLDISAKTYYLPEKTLNINSKDIKQ